MYVSRSTLLKKKPVNLTVNRSFTGQVGNISPINFTSNTIYTDNVGLPVMVRAINNLLIFVGDICQFAYINIQPNQDHSNTFWLQNSGTYISSLHIW